MYVSEAEAITFNSLLWFLSVQFSLRLVLFIFLIKFFNGFVSLHILPQENIFGSSDIVRHRLTFYSLFTIQINSLHAYLNTN